MSELYISVDVETDGPIPGINSMLSIGAAAFTADGKMHGTFEANLEQLVEATTDASTMKWWETQPEAWARCRMDPQSPHHVMASFSLWVTEMSVTAGFSQVRPVFVGYPAGFDFLFTYWYLIRFTGSSPFSFSALDVKSFAMAQLGCGYREVSKRELKPFIPKNLPHTHVGVDDAIEQGHMFVNMLKASRDQPEASYRHHLFNLLARIHRDGGHYTEKHGVEKAVADADEIVASLLHAASVAPIADKVGVIAELHATLRLTEIALRHSEVNNESDEARRDGAKRRDRLREAIRFIETFGTSA